MCILLRFLLLNESLCPLGVWECEVQFSQCEGQLSQFYLQVLLLPEVLLSVLDLLCVLSGQFCFGGCPNWRSRRSVHLVIFLRGLVVSPFVLGFLCKSSGQFCFGDCLNW